MSLAQQREWHPVRGVPGAHWHALVRRPDVLSCNSYLIEFPEAMVLIDPGALPTQTAALRGAMAQRESGRSLPLLIFLTHCHFDHSHEVPALLGDPDRPAWLAAQETGALALANGDHQMTAAELYGMAVVASNARVPLLTAEDLRRPEPRTVELASGVDVRIRTVANEQGFSQTLELGRSVKIEILSCAGHSPDSVCYRIGDLLFIGDLLLAHRPLVAGIYGWDNQRLTHSLGRMIGVLENGGVSLCCPGHGDPLPAEKALGLLRRQQDKSGQFDDVSAMNAQRLFQAVDMALELIDEAEEVFSSIAGRLLYVADRMEMLEEDAEARRCRDALDMDAVDAMLLAFRTLCRSMETGELPRVAFAVEATGIVEKLRKTFRPEAVSSILPTSLVNRAHRLLLDFMGIAQGVRNLEEFMPVELASLLADVERAWNASPHLDESLFEHLENDEWFAADLARRIGHPPIAQRIPVDFEMAASAQPICAAGIRFCDTMVHFLEWLAMAGASAVHVFQRGEETIDVRADGLEESAASRIEAKRGSFARRFALAGFDLAWFPDFFRLTFSGDKPPGS